MSLDDRNAELNEKLEQNPIDSQIAALIKADARRKSQVRLLFICFGLLIALSVVLGYVSWKTNQIARVAQSNRAAVIANCEVANQSRDDQRQLWSYVISLTPERPRTDEQQERTDDFEAYVNKTFAHRDCMAEIKSTD